MNKTNFIIIAVVFMVSGWSLCKIVDRDNILQYKKDNISQYKKYSEDLQYYRHVVKLRDYTIREHIRLKVAKEKENKRQIAYSTLRIKHLTEGNKLMDNFKGEWSNWPEIKKANDELIERQSVEKDALIVVLENPDSAF